MYYNDDNNDDSDNDYELINDNNIIYKEDIYQFKMRQIENFKNLIYCEPEFIAIHNISSQEILNIIEYNINNNLNKNEYKKFNYKPTDDQIILFQNIYETILKTLYIKKYTINQIDIIWIINKIYSKLYI